MISVLEVANRNLKKIFYTLTYLGTPLGYLLAGGFYDSPYHWRQLSLIASISTLFLPILEWYVFYNLVLRMATCRKKPFRYFPESPRWLMSKNRKTKAFAILQNIKNPEMQEELLGRYKNFDRGYLSTLKEHLNQIKPVICTLAFICASVLFVGIGVTALESFHCKYKT